MYFYFHFTLCRPSLVLKVPNLTMGSQWSFGGTSTKHSHVTHSSNYIKSPVFKILENLSIWAKPINSTKDSLFWYHSCFYFSLNVPPTTLCCFSFFRRLLAGLQRLRSIVDFLREHEHLCWKPHPCVLGALWAVTWRLSTALPHSYRKLPQSLGGLTWVTRWQKQTSRGINYRSQYEVNLPLNMR